MRLQSTIATWLSPHGEVAGDRGVDVVNTSPFSAGRFASFRVAAPGDLRCKGAELGVLVTRGHVQTNNYQLTERCRRWVEGINAQFASTPPAPGEAAPPIVSPLVARV